MLSVRALHRSIAKAIGAARSDEKFHCGEIRDRHKAFRLDSGLDVSVVVDMHRQVMANSCSRPLCFFNLSGEKSQSWRILICCVEMLVAGILL